MDKIIWQLGADSSQVRSEMDKAVSSVNRATAGMSTGFGNATRSSNSFLESNNRVTNQVGGFTRSLLNARSAADVLSSGLDRLENATNLSLGKGIFLAAAAVAVQTIHRLRTEYEKLDEEVKKLFGSSPSAIFRTSAAVETHVNKVTESLARLRKESQGGMVQNFIDAFGENLFTDEGELLPDSGKAGRRRVADIAAGEQKEMELKEGEVSRRRVQSDLKASNAPGAEKEAIAAGIKFRELNSAVHMQTQALIEFTATLREITKKYNDLKMERAGMSLKEMAATPEATSGFNADGTTWSLTYEQWMAGKKAREAQALEAGGESARLNMQPEQAHNLFSQAGEAKEGLTGLKPSEKMSADFKGALAVSEGYLQTIAESKTTLVNK